MVGAVGLDVQQAVAVAKTIGADQGGAADGIVEGDLEGISGASAVALLQAVGTVNSI